MNQAAAPMEPPIFTTTLTISSKSPLYTRTEKIDLINKELLEELTIKAIDPNHEFSHAQDMIALLGDIKQYEESIILSKVITIIDRGVQRMKNSGRPFGIEISELTKLREELMKHLSERQDMCMETRRICQEVTRETSNQRLRLEIQLKRVEQPAIQM
ncbi:uncharacterized protein LOC135118656 [Helicoverpa armigera]|uniref:uncharacterized protein LOC135118656 n=1 Tax=Helicoverpa armigera TaxID=29058 RepID=UPI000B3AFA04